MKENNKDNETSPVKHSGDRLLQRYLNFINDVN